MKRAVRSLVRIFWGVTATLIILLALVVQLGRTGSFLVSDYRQDLASYWSETLQLSIVIGDMQLRWRGLRPEFIAHNLQVHTPAGDHVAVLRSTRVQFLLLPSLLQLRPVISEFEVDGLELDFQQDEAGRWSIEGFSRRITSKDASGEHENKARKSNFTANPFDAFLFGRLVQLSDAKLEFNFRNGQQVNLVVPEITLENTRNFHRLSLRMDIGERKDMVTLVVEGEGDPRDSAEFNSRAYLRIVQLPTDKLLSAASKKWLSEHELTLSGGEVDLELWLRGGEQGFEFSGRMDASDLPALGREREHLQQLGANLQGYWHRAGDWQLNLLDLSLSWQAALLQLDVQVGAKGVGEPLELAVANLPLGEISRLTKAQLGADTKFYSLLERLNARGNLRQLNLTIPLDEPKNFLFEANLDQVAVDALGGAPALTQVDGYVRADKAGGLVELDSRNGFSMHYSIYDEAMHYQKAYGAVAWHLRPDDNAIIVNSSQLSLRGEDGEAEGFLYIDLPWVKGSRSSEMTLQIGLRNTQAKYYRKYVPRVVPESLRQWLGSSISIGSIDWAGFIYRGSLSPGDSAGRTVQVAVHMDGARLDYHPSWPQLQDVRAQLIVDDTEVDVAVESARIYDSLLSETDVVVTPNDTGKGMLLRINTHLQGPAGDGLRVLRESKLRETLGDAFDEWTLTGTMDADLALIIPLTSGEAGAQQTVDVVLNNADLQMQSLNLEFEGLRGKLHFDERRGLSAKSLKGRFFQQPFRAAIYTDRGRNKTQIKASGAVQADLLARWTRRPELYFLQGLIPFDADLQLFHGVNNKAGLEAEAQVTTRAQTTAQTTAQVSKQVKTQAVIPTDPARKYPVELSITSNLQGVSIALPAPYAKSLEDRQQVKVDIKIGKQGSNYVIDYAHLAQLAFTLVDAQVQGITLLFLDGEAVEAVRPPTKREFYIAGRLPRVDFFEWRQEYQRYQRYRLQMQQTAAAVKLGSISANKAVATLPVKLDTHIDHFSLGEFNLEDLKVTGVYQQNNWTLDLENTVLLGRLQVPDVAPTAKRPLQLALQYLRLPVLESALVKSSAVKGATEDTKGKEPAELTEERIEKTASAARVNADDADDLLASIDPRDLPALNFSTDEWSIGEKNYGHWRFLLRPRVDGARLERIFGRVNGVEIAGTEAVAGATLNWSILDGKSYSHFRGELSSDDLSSTLQQFDQPDLMESKTARFVAHLGWQGSPAAIGLNQLKGQVELDVRNGRFLRSGDSSNNPLLRLFGLLNFDTLARRLQLDFSDMYKSGMVFDSIKGDLEFDEGKLYLQKPLRVRTPSSRLQLAGVIDLKNEQLDATLVAALPLASPLALLAAITAGLPVAAGVYLAGKIFEEQVDKLTSVSYYIKGSWEDPNVEFNRVFDAKAAKRSGKKARLENTKSE